MLEERLRAEIYPAVVDDPYFTVNLKGHKIYITYICHVVPRAGVAHAFDLQRRFLLCLAPKIALFCC